MVSVRLQEPNADGVVCVHIDEKIANPGLRRMAACVRDLRPLAEAYGRQHGQGITMAALITIVANQAIACGDTKLIADALRQNADMLDPKMDAEPVERRPYRATEQRRTGNDGTAL